MGCLLQGEEPPSPRRKPQLHQSSRGEFSTTKPLYLGRPRSTSAAAGPHRSMGGTTWDGAVWGAKRSSGRNQWINRHYTKRGGFAEMLKPRAQTLSSLGRCWGKRREHRAWPSWKRERGFAQNEPPARSSRATARTEGVKVHKIPANCTTGSDETQVRLSQECQEVKTQGKSHRRGARSGTAQGKPAA